MKNRFLKILLSLMHLVLLAIPVSVFVGRVFAENLTLDLILFSALALILGLFAISYQFSLSENIEQRTPFMSLFLYAAQLSVVIETLLLTNLVNVFGLPSILVAKVLIFCEILMPLALCGYGLFSHNLAKEPVSLFTLSILFSSYCVAVMIPKIQGVFEISRNIPLFVIFTALILIDVTIFFVLLITDPLGTQSIKNIAGLFLVINTWVLINSTTTIQEMIGIGLAFIVSVLLIIIPKSCSIKI